MNKGILKRIEAVELTAETLLDNEPLRIVHIDCGLTLEESNMLKAYHGEPERGGRITQIQIVPVSPNNRPPRPMDELIRVWDKALLEAKED